MRVVREGCSEVVTLSCELKEEESAIQRAKGRAKQRERLVERSWGRKEQSREGPGVLLARLILFLT